MLLAVVIGLLTAFAGAAPALAHNAFTGSNPKNGARLSEPPETVTLSFLAKLDPATTKVVVTGPDGVAATDGTPGVKGNKVSVGVRPGAAGEYTVAYQIASSDGHPIKGRIRFTVADGGAAETGASAAPGTGSSTPAEQSPTGATAAPTAAATTGATTGALVPVADEDSGTAWWPWLLGAVLLAAAAGAGALVLRRRTTH